MLKSFSLDQETGSLKPIAVEQVRERLDQGEMVWVDALNPGVQEYGLLQEEFGFSELTIEDAQEPFHLPKLDEYPDHLFFIWFSLSTNKDVSGLLRSQLNVFLGARFLVTIHQDPIASIEGVIDMLPRKGFPRLTPDWILHMVLDTFVDDYLPLLDTLSNEIDLLEDKVFVRPSEELIKEVFALKHKMAGVKKIVAPQRDVIASLVHFESSYIASQHTMYFRDIYDHLIHVIDLIESSSATITGIIDIYLASISNKMNEVMTRLTVVATVVMPLTLLTGVYGMNFRYMPELNSAYGYPAVITVMLAFGIASYWYLKKKVKW